MNEVAIIINGVRYDAVAGNNIHFVTVVNCVTFVMMEIITTKHYVRNLELQGLQFLRNQLKVLKDE